MKLKQILPIYLVYFLDTLGFIIVLPFFSNMIFSTESILINQNLTLVYRNLLYIVLSGAFPLGMFLGAPLIGSAADHWGRKKTFLLILTGILVGNLLASTALYLTSYYLFLFARFFTGFFSASLTLCLTILSENNPDSKTRAKKFGTLIAIGGLSWITAILLSHLFNNTYTFLAAAALTLLNLWIIKTRYTDTPKPTTPFHFTSLFYAFHASKVRRLFGTLFLFSASWFTCLQWFAGFTLERFQIHHTLFLICLLAIGLSWTIGSFPLNRLFIHTWILPKIPFLGLLILIPLLIAAGQLDTYPPYLLLNCLITAISAFVLSNLLNLISISTPDESQGNIIGISQSFIAAALFTSPIFGTLFILSNFPRFYILAAILITLASILLWSDMTLLKNQRKR